MKLHHYRVETKTQAYVYVARSSHQALTLAENDGLIVVSVTRIFKGE